MINFTEEQQEFLDRARNGEDVIVDACIGSGKTTSIQAACEIIKGRVLYLTYNRRLLEEARKRIETKNADVHTFHSFAGSMLNSAGIGAGSEREVIPNFVRSMKRVYRYDAVIVDEYQDISEDLKDMLWHICRMSYNNYGFCPQFLIVGDRDQKISDNTNIDAAAEARDLMRFLDGVHGRTHAEMQFTNCFRLSAGYAADIGQAWNKSIIGLNNDCNISEMTVDSCVSFLSKFDPQDILVLGNNMSWGARVEIQNALERMWPDKFNKDTVYSSVSEYDCDRRNIDASKCAIFTTFDAAKGLERKVCVVCNYDSGYLDARMKHQTSRDVLKNLFLVAASRGKEYNIFCRKRKGDVLDFKEVGRISGTVPIDMRPAYMSDMFDYKIKEDVDACLECLDVITVQEPGDEIKAETKVGQIDISMCQGIYAQASYFENYDIDYMVGVAWNERIAKGNFPKLPKYNKKWELWKKILYLVAVETGQERYISQIHDSYVTPESEKMLADRMDSMFDASAAAERTCTIIYKNCEAGGIVMGDRLVRGRADILVAGIPWELKFAQDLKGEHALQAALYSAGLGSDFAMLYNIRNNEVRKVIINDRPEFLRRTLACLSKHKLVSDMAAVSGGAVDL